MFGTFESILNIIVAERKLLALLVVVDQIDESLLLDRMRFRRAGRVTD